MPNVERTDGWDSTFQQPGRDFDFALRGCELADWGYPRDDLAREPPCLVLREPDSYGGFGAHDASEETSLFHCAQISWLWGSRVVRHAETEKLTLSHSAAKLKNVPLQPIISTSEPFYATLQFRDAGGGVGHLSGVRGNHAEFANVA
ncbi:hypothetical protein [Streptomyces buecherae]|uniref:hypothetical protein n=1 Tax=Streptomyces buecherae TaxID=2763006 RepID=UPI0027E20179|nr:hypothetical protein [Streptomyces buecherae]